MFNSPSLSDIAAVTGGNRNDGFGDGNGWWILIILFALWGGFGGYGYGNGGGQGGVGAEIQRGFDTSAITMKLDGITNGLCDGFYAVNNTIQQGNFGLQTAMLQGFNATQAQLANCCCENREAIAQVRYDMATDTCAITNAMNQGFAQLDRTINDKFCDLEMKNMQRTIDEQASQIQTLNLAVSQRNQNDYLVDKLRPCPTPTYLTCNPWAAQAPYGSCSPCNGCN